MKKLYIRFFDNKLSGIPTDSHIICRGDITFDLMRDLIKVYAYESANWMINHPEGKVDFVWLS